uniref:Uncharacterized protein n=1 Tax=Solanum lycopersicum TaxID=4081 RepID=A0A3Q7EYQ4_SOLLC
MVVLFPLYRSDEWSNDFCEKGIQNCDDDIVMIPDSVKSQGEGIWKELLLKPTKSLRWILIAGVGIHFFEHATGIEAVILYSHKIFAKAGVHDHKHQILATCGVGLTKFSFIVLWRLEDIDATSIIIMPSLEEA